ncbi:MAG TPA: hypothetical protein VIJ22_05910, partial [Polyangiaceae bacterium]
WAWATMASTSALSAPASETSTASSARCGRARWWRRRRLAFWPTPIAAQQINVNVVAPGGEQACVLRADERDQRHRHEEGPREARREVMEGDDVCSREDNDAENDERAQRVPLHGTLATTN